MSHDSSMPLGLYVSRYKSRKSLYGCRVIFHLNMVNILDSRESLCDSRLCLYYSRLRIYFSSMILYDSMLRLFDSRSASMTPIVIFYHSSWASPIHGWASAISGSAFHDSMAAPYLQGEPLMTPEWALLLKRKHQLLQDGNPLFHDRPLSLHNKSLSLQGEGDPLLFNGELFRLWGEPLWLHVGWTSTTSSCPYITQE